MAGTKNINGWRCLIKKLLNEELNLACPEGFREMDQAERAKLNMLKDGEGVCLTDPARHLVLSVGWKRTGRLLSFLARRGLRVISK